MAIVVQHMMIFDLEATMRNEAAATGSPPEFFSTQVLEARVKEVAYELGFRDTFHFSRAFKKVFGVSPDTFRKLR